MQIQSVTNYGYKKTYQPSNKAHISYELANNYNKRNINFNGLIKDFYEEPRLLLHPLGLALISMFLGTAAVIITAIKSCTDDKKVTQPAQTTQTFDREIKNIPINTFMVSKSKVKFHTNMP